MAFKMRSAHPNPLQHGVHQPQDSCAKTCIMFQVMPTGHVRSSSTIMVPVPRRLPILDIAVKSIGVSRYSSVTKSVETPPGNNPRNVTPSRIPPAWSSRISRIVVPIGSSHSPGRFTFPLAPNNLVPACCVRLKARNHAAPWLMMCGTQHSVSTLLTTVGLPKRPTTGGYGGFDLGLARLPSSALSKPVSSPHM